MNIDEILRTSVDELARRVTPPPPDPDGVRTQARATRRRQWVAAAAGTAAAVVLGGVAITSGLPNQGSTPADKPTPSPSTSMQMKEMAIWSEATSLHFGSSGVAVPRRIFGFGLVAGGVVYSTGGPRNAELFFQPIDGGEATQIGDNAELSPAGDPTSGLAAWFEEVDRQGSLVVFDTNTAQEVARTSVRPALTPQANILFPGSSPVISVTSDAVYYRGRNEEIWVYRWPDGDAPETTGKTMDELFDVASGVTAQAGTEEGSVEFVTADRTTVATDLPSISRGGYLSPDGNSFASLDGGTRSNPGAVVFDTTTGETTELDLSGSGAEPGLPLGVGWSGNDTLMINSIPSDETSGDRMPPSQVIECTVSTGKCDVVATVKQGYFVTVPVT